MMVCGRTIWQTDTVFFIMLMEIFMKVYGLTTKLTAMVHTDTLMVLLIQENGLRTNSTVAALNLGQTVQSTMVSIRTEKRTAKVI